MKSCLIALAALLALAAMPCAAGGLQLISAVYRADEQFPEYMPVWQEGWPEEDANGEKVRYATESMPKGAYIHVYYRNSGAGPIKLKDVALNGVSLTEAVAATDKDDYGGMRPTSIHFSALPKASIERVVAAGEPVWWRREPKTVDPGKMGEVIIRLRRMPTVKSIPIKLIAEGETLAATAFPEKAEPRFMDVCFSENLDTVTCYVRRVSKAGVAPTRFLIDGREATFDAATDVVTDINPITVKLKEPFEKASYHLFQAIFPDGSTATAGARAWSTGFVWGMWGSKPDIKEYMTDWARHNVNVHMGMSSSETQHYLLTDEGYALVRGLGMRQVDGPGNARKPLMFFLLDEPDAHDFETGGLTAFDRLGSLGQPLVKRSEGMRGFDASVPQLLNLDNTYKPNNYYTYAQLADMPCSDPYYEVRIGNTSLATPEDLAFHLKPLFVYAAGSILHSAGAPKPMHLLLFTCGCDPSDEKSGRYPTPEEKTMEVYYALGSGAKGISFWWFTPTPPCGGCGADAPTARALYREIGLLGAQARTIGSLIVRSTPVPLPVKTDSRLWVRTLAAGTDSIVLLVVNNDVVCDRLGTAIRPILKTDLTLTLPSWLKARDAFEVTVDGTKDIKWTPAATNAAVDLGRVDLARMIVITSNAKLRQELQTLYNDKFAANVASLKQDK